MIRRLRGASRLAGADTASGSRRVPTMADALRVLTDSGVEIRTVLDVGVLDGTEALIRTFGAVPHHLFEPAAAHYPAIARNYRRIAHQVHPVALSDRDGAAYLVSRSIRRDGAVTHARISDRPVAPASVPGFVACVEIPMARLDTIIARDAQEPPYLLKIDVDGHELAVLAGARQTLSQAAIVVIEAPLNRVALPQFFERSRRLLDAGFCLMDVTELAYYDGVLWQADLVFARRDLVHGLARLQPFESPDFTFRPADWYPLTERYFSP